MHLVNAAVLSLNRRIGFFLFFFKIKQNQSAPLHNQNTFLEKIEVVLFVFYTLNIYL